MPSLDKNPTVRYIVTMKTNKKESQVALNLIHGMSESMGTDACRKAGIKLYPAWIARNGPRVYVTIPEDEE